MEIVLDLDHQRESKGELDRNPNAVDLHHAVAHQLVADQDRHQETTTDAMVSNNQGIVVIVGLTVEMVDVAVAEIVRISLKRLVHPVARTSLRTTRMKQ